MTRAWPHIVDVTHIRTGTTTQAPYQSSFLTPPLSLCATISALYRWAGPRVIAPLQSCQENRLVPLSNSSTPSRRGG
ncbi:hypothetical protein MAR_021475 [Mya arenaria]|uniref:Uncharacterized protein n=1 Tax=Mya arenaria TaxID=6604 RepID=A0ABY7EBS1_MYAAR|nr:hypothetical protein MAR_021475 [Mya arenaria]